MRTSANAWCAKVTWCSAGSVSGPSRCMPRVRRRPLFEPALTDLLDTLDIVNRFANRGLEDLMQRALEELTATHDVTGPLVRAIQGGHSVGGLEEIRAARRAAVEDALRQGDLAYRVYGGFRFYERAEIRDTTGRNSAAAPTFCMKEDITPTVPEMIGMMRPSVVPPTWRIPAATWLITPVLSRPAPMIMTAMMETTALLAKPSNSRVSGTRPRSRLRRSSIRVRTSAWRPWARKLWGKDGNME